tara:strand:+ start:869 stop:1150 length:282 start_codon:yes stop_codon:yes gene_type:complete
MSNSFIVEHIDYGIGTAILTKERRDKRLDLFMCSFRGLKKQRTFYCRKHFDAGEEVWWSDGKPRKAVRRRSKQEELEDALRGFFSSGGQPINS